MPHPLSRRLALGCAALLAAIAVASCGGGGDGGTAPFTGFWQGTLDGSRPASAILLGDGSYYMTVAASDSAPAGLVRGTRDAQAEGFTSGDGVAYHFAYPPQAPTPVSISGTVEGRRAISATVDAAPLALAYDQAFDPDGSLADLAGSYPGEVTFSLGLRQTVFDVTADGALSTTLNGCSITGQVVPRADRAFDLTIQFGGAPCVFPGAVFGGAAIYSQPLQRLEAAVVNAALGQAITFTASRAAP